MYPYPPTCLNTSPQMTLNVPSFLIDTVFDEVSKDGPALSQMRSDPRRQLAAGIVGVSGDPFACTSGAHLVTLRHFDTKVGLKAKIGPLIPWERRLTNMEI